MLGAILGVAAATLGSSLIASHGASKAARQGLPGMLIRLISGATPYQELGSKPFAAQWTQTCGNDGVAMQGDLPPVHMPEPTTLALFGLALAGLRARRRRR